VGASDAPDLRPSRFFGLLRAGARGSFQAASIQQSVLGCDPHSFGDIGRGTDVRANRRRDAKPAGCTGSLQVNDALNRPITGAGPDLLTEENRSALANPETSSKIGLHSLVENVVRVRPV
jgi:hypothetical protein